MFFKWTANEFWRGRDYFLDKRIRDRALREAAAADFDGLDRRELL